MIMALFTTYQAATQLKGQGQSTGIEGAADVADAGHGAANDAVMADADAVTTEPAIEQEPTQLEAENVAVQPAQPAAEDDVEPAIKQETEDEADAAEDDTDGTGTVRFRCRIQDKNTNLM